MKPGLVFLLAIVVLGGCATVHEPSAGHQTLVVGEVSFVSSGLVPSLLDGEWESGMTLKIQNLADQSIYSAMSTNTGVVTFADVPAGKYELLALSAHIQASNYTADFNYLPRGHDWLFEVVPNEVNNLGKIVWTTKVTSYQGTSTMGRTSSTRLLAVHSHSANAGYDETRQAFQHLYSESKWLALNWDSRPLTADVLALGSSSLKLNRFLVQQELGDHPFQLTATAAAGDPPVSWSSADPNVAVVTPTGLVTALGLGTTRITASEPSSSVSALVVVWRQDPPLTYTFVSAEPASYNRDFWHVPEGQTPGRLADRPVTVTLEKLSGQPGVAYGVLFCYRDTNNFYQVLVDTLGNYQVGKRVNGEFEKLVTFRPCPGIRSGEGSANTITISQPKPGTIALTVNGTALPPVLDDTFTEGTLAFFAAVGTPRQNPPEQFPQTPEKLSFTLGPVPGAPAQQ